MRNSPTRANNNADAHCTHTYEVQLEKKEAAPHYVAVTSLYFELLFTPLSNCSRLKKAPLNLRNKRAQRELNP